jgi:hypothetical protein
VVCLSAGQSASGRSVRQSCLLGDVFVGQVVSSRHACVGRGDWSLRRVVCGVSVCRSVGAGWGARAWLSAINSSDAGQAERRVVQAERACSVVSSAWLSFAVGRASQVACVASDRVPRLDLFRSQKLSFSLFCTKGDGHSAPARRPSRALGSARSSVASGLTCLRPVFLNTVSLRRSSAVSPSCVQCRASPSLSGSALSGLDVGNPGSQAWWWW